MKLNSVDNLNFFIPQKVLFEPNVVNKLHVLEVLDFAYDMTFGNKGVHRNYRSGGMHYRKNGEIFCDTFQGKLAEFFFYKSLFDFGISCPKPEIDRWEKGKWDDQDFLINNTEISIKSMAFFSNLLLLETKDWDLRGNYRPNKKKYDLIVIVRIKPDLKSFFRSRRILYTNFLDKGELREMITKIDFEADIPGFVQFEELLKIIQQKQILPQNAFLNGRTKMDAENYYVLSKDFIKFENIKSFIKK